MASLTITRNITQQGVGLTAPIVPFRIQQGIEFIFDHGGVTGTSCKVVMLGLYFECLKVEAYTETSDLYRLDMSFMDSIIGIAPDSVSVTGLTKDTAYSVEGYVNGVKVAEISSYPFTICFAKPTIGFARGIYDLWNDGTTRTIYHCGKHCVYDKVTNAYIITSSTINTAPYVYKQTDGDELAWIDRDGKWSFWNFRKLSETRNAKKTNEVQNYALSNYELKSRSYMLDTELTVQIKLDTICINADHYRQMTEIAESERVIFAGLAYNVAECSKTSAECRQNMKFNLVLEREENA